MLSKMQKNRECESFFDAATVEVPGRLLEIQQGGTENLAYNSRRDKRLRELGELVTNNAAIITEGKWAPTGNPENSDAFTLPVAAKVVPEIGSEKSKANTQASMDSPKTDATESVDGFILVGATTGDGDETTDGFVLV